jgi:hypothetical protein
VGRTSQKPAKRLQHHLSATKRRVDKPVYAWIRSIAPSQPLIVILQEVEYVRATRTDGTYESATGAAETKWMKRFERSRILNSIDKQTRVWFAAHKRKINRASRARTAQFQERA